MADFTSTEDNHPHQFPSWSLHLPFVVHYAYQLVVSIEYLMPSTPLEYARRRCNKADHHAPISHAPNFVLTVLRHPT